MTIIGVVHVKACGLIVEYNPFHYGHLHHLQSAKRVANADCMIAVMSGSFLQRGEPAIIDKFHRTRAAIESGADIVIELPYAYAVQSSELFAEGAIKSLHELGIDSVCFGSESGEIDDFLNAFSIIDENKVKFEKALHTYLNDGEAFPTASSKAYKAIGLAHIDLFKPNNILGFSYVQAIKKNKFPIAPLTIKRINNEFHDETISNPIASATSIRKEMLAHDFSNKAKNTLPDASLQQLHAYKLATNQFHDWEKYFQLLHYQVTVQNVKELNSIHGVDEGLEYRIKRTAPQAESFYHWIQLIKTKRYTQTRLQRLFVHVLTNSTKEVINEFIELPHIPYVRLLGLSTTGQSYLNRYKKQLQVPIYTNLTKENGKAMQLDEKAMNTYYAVLSSKNRIKMRSQEFQLPIIN